MKTRITKALAVTALLGAALVGGGGATATASGAVNAFEAICNVSGGEVVFEGTDHKGTVEFSPDRPGCVIHNDEVLPNTSAAKFNGVCKGIGYDRYWVAWHDFNVHFVYFCMYRSEVELG